MKDAFQRIIFLVSLLVLGVTYGIFAAMHDWPPAPQVRQAQATRNTLREHWLNDFGFVPTRHLNDAEDPHRPAFRAVQPELISPGYVLISGLTPRRETLQGAVLFDAQGEEVHYWPLDYPSLVPGHQPEHNVLLHGLAALPDGTVVVAFDNGDAVVRVDACGKPVWITRGSFDHVVSPTTDGALWAWRAEELVKLDIDTGEILDVIGLKADIIESQGLHGMLAIRSYENKDRLQYTGDPFHGNDIEPLSPAMAAAFPQFEAGDLLISLRELNFVGVLEPATRRLKWWSYGPWFKQHDPDFLPDGQISVYDNGMGLGRSRIVRIDPKTNEWTVSFQGSDALPFYSWRRGKHQVLANGHLLITESERGRVFEVTADGQLVWERNMIYDKGRNFVVTDAVHLAEDYFDEGALDCERS